MDKNMIKLALVLIILAYVASGCGKAPNQSIDKELPATAHIVDSKEHQLTPVKLCGVSLIEIGNHVEDSSGQVIPNGSYTEYGSTSCTYTVLDGKVF